MNINVLVLGCGGTGSWLANRAIQLLAKYSKENAKSYNEIVFIDHDTVELKNTLRQAFSETDVGTNKAVSLVKRYGPAYKMVENMNISVIQKYVLDNPSRTEYLEKFLDFDIAEEFTGENVTCIAISVIDNNLTRKSIHDSFSRCSRSHYIVDSGNEDVYGQTTISSYCNGHQGGFNSFWELHPEMLEFNDGVKAGPSCAEHDEEESNAGVEQTMSANFINAGIAIDQVSLLIDLISGKEKEIHNEIGFLISNNGITYNYK